MAGIGVIIGIILGVPLVIWFVVLLDRGTRGTRYDEFVDELERTGCKITYYNKTTGTIRYRGNDKRVHSESLYRGYRSHWRGDR